MEEADVVEIKEEADARAPGAAASSSTTKRKGRPRKAQQTAVVEVED